MSEMYPEKPPPEDGRYHSNDAWIRGQVEHALAEGEHVHANLVDGQEYCMGGQSDCPFWELQLKEALETWS